MALKVGYERVFKTLVVELKGQPNQLSVAIVPVSIAGKRGLEIELSPQDPMELTSAKTALINVGL